MNDPDKKKPKDDKRRPTNQGVDTTPSTAEEEQVVSNSKAKGKVESALHYAQEHGLAVFPCHSGAKTPATSNGFKAATKDPDKIQRLIQPSHNLGVRTGLESGVFVLDVDMPGGDESLEALEAERGELPETVLATTPRGGLHFYFAYPRDCEVNNSAGTLAKKLDIRGEGGYVVAPPSSTTKGSYAWVEGKAPGEVPIAEAPEWLIERATKEPSRKKRSCVKRRTVVEGTVAEGLPDEIPEGKRNDSLMHEAGRLRRRGYGEDDIIAVLSVINSQRCNPPLPACEVHQIAASATRYEPEGGIELADATLPFQSFPVEKLPEPVRTFVTEGAAAIGCDPSYIALPLLSGLASAIGNSCKVQLKGTWSEPSILWTAIVGESGTTKSPALELALRPVRERQERDIGAYQFALGDYETAMMVYERDLARWRRNQNSDAPPPERPERPSMPRTWADDVTVEALAMLLLEQPRGLLLACDELASWFGGFDRYSQASGGDAARWLEMFGARQMVVDRKSGEPRTIVVPRASVCVTGGIQPSVLNRALSRTLRENGLAARILIVYPPRVPKRWTEADLSPEVEAKIEKLFDRLYGLGASTGEEEAGGLQTRELPLSEEAKQEFVAFFNNHAVDQAASGGDLAAAFAKLEGAAARLALVLHLAEWAASDEPEPGPVSVENMRRGRRLVEWFKYETRRVYALLSESEEDREIRKVVQAARENGGSATARDLQRKSPSEWPTSEEAEQALERAKQAGKGEWVCDPPSPKGGRPKRELRLFDSVEPDETGSNPGEE